MRLTLKTKIWLTVLSIVLMFSFFSLYYFPSQQEKYLLNDYNNEVQNLANTISLGVKIALRDENFEGVQTAMSFVTEDPRLSFVNLIVFDTVWNDDHTEFQLDESVLRSFPEDSADSSKTIDSTTIVKKRADFTTDMMSGAIELAVTTEYIELGKRKIRLASLLVSGVFFIIGIIIGFWLSRNISIPVLALRDAAIRVGEGDLTQRVMNKSGDEIGELSTAFNKMVADLEMAREELRKANIELHKTVSDLKATQEQLVHSEKMASLGQLTAGIAHEINNPINFVSANIQPLKDDMADIALVIDKYDEVIRRNGMENSFKEIERIKADLDIPFTRKEIDNLLKGIEDGARRTSEIVKGLKNFSRLDQDVFKNADINESLDSSLTLLHNSYKNRIEIVKEFGSLPEVECYPGQMNQVYMNILSNAIEAISGKGKIFLKTWQDHDMVKVSIKDTGAGIPEEVKTKIFDPFFTTKDVGKGTGLGLSITFGIIQKHNGNIEVFSTPGVGTEFVISIPINQKQ